MTATPQAAPGDVIECGIDLPMIDSLSTHAGDDVSILLIPSRDVSEREKELVVVRRQGITAGDWCRVHDLMAEIGRVLGEAAPLQRVTHAGGDRYTLRFGGDALVDTATCGKPAHVLERALGCLNRIADMAQGLLRLRQSNGLNAVPGEGPGRQGQVYVFASAGAFDILVTAGVDMIAATPTTCSP